MDTGKLRAFCNACRPEQWRALEGADRSKVLSGNALVVQGHPMDVNAIVAFANAIPELLDTIERQADEIETARATENTLGMEMDELRAQLEDEKHNVRVLQAAGKDAALRIAEFEQELESEQKKVRVLRKGLTQRLAEAEQSDG